MLDATANTTAASKVADTNGRFAALFLSVNAAAQRYGVSRRAMWRRVNDGTVAFVRLGDKPLIDVAATDAMLRQAA